MDRRRISLSLKSDAASRAGTGEKSPAKRDFSAPRTNSTGAKKVVVVKKSSSSNSTEKPRDRRPNNSGSDDGMSYNPFAAFFNK